MSRLSRPRFGSLQFYPRKRAAKFLHSVNWAPVNGEGLVGFIVYKVGMGSIFVKDFSDKSMTSGKRIVVPATILEAPRMKAFSVRFYKNGKIIKEIIVSNDKELKRKLKIPKIIKNFDSEVPKEHDNIRIIFYSLVKQTSLKKTPDLIEIAIKGNNKLEFVKSLIGKEINITEFFKYDLVDVRGLTKGKGLQGPVKRFGIGLKQHKSEKGVRRPGSLGPWHPARVTFRTPMAGQLGLFSRIHYNQKIIAINNIEKKNINPKAGFKHYGEIKGDYVIIKGSVQGPAKRQVLLTPAFRATKHQSKKKYEMLEVAI